MIFFLRYLFPLFFSFFSFFFVVVVVVGLARDGCLVRSWLFGHAVGLAVERSERAARVLGVASKATTNNRASDVL